ncbi:MAG: putative toxin-antitoxin system toxin component, PIN family [Blastocatellales bacterium]
MPFITEVQKRLFTREHLRRRYRYSDEEVAYSISGLRNFATIVNELPTIQIVRDPNDDFIIATAVKANAEYLVARDKDLLTLGRHENISIITPKAFLQILKNNTQEDEHD